MSISTRFSSQLSLENSLIGEILACGKNQICSFYSGDTQNAIIDLKNKDVWVIENNVQENVYLSIFESFDNKLKFTGLKILKLDIDHPLFVYRLRIKSPKSIPNIIYRTNKTKRLGRVIEKPNQQVISVDLIGLDDSNPELLIFGGDKCEVELEFRFDAINSFVKVRRLDSFMDIIFRSYVLLVAFWSHL